MSRGLQVDAPAAFRAVVETSVPARDAREAYTYRSAFGLYQTRGAARAAATRESRLGWWEKDSGITRTAWVEEAPLEWSRVE